MKMIMKIMKEGEKQLHDGCIGYTLYKYFRLNVNESENNHNEFQDSLLDYSDD